jgi:hypothetical protein
MMIEEQHYRVKDIAKMLRICLPTTRKLFRDEPGVLKITKPRSRYGPIKRGYETLLVPAHVFERVKKRLSGAASEWSR